MQKRLLIKSNLMFLHYFSLLKDYSVGIIWIVVVFAVLKLVLEIGVKRILRRIVFKSASKKESLEHRLNTIWDVFSTLGNAVIYIVVLLMILNLCKVNLAPILAGISIVGLVVGFGAQALIKDFISGIFILMENQYNLGDQVQIGLSSGRVIRVNLRSVVLEDEDGKVHYIPNGTIISVINSSQRNSKK